MIAAELRGGNKPSLNEALGWIGSRVDDIYGANVGRLEDVWIDPGSGVPRWLLVKEGRFGGRTTLIPFEDATAGAGHVWVPYEREIVREAPEIEPGAPLTHQVEAALRGHYAANAPAAISHRGQPSTQPVGRQPGSALGTATVRLHGPAEAGPPSAFDHQAVPQHTAAREAPSLHAQPRAVPQPRRQVLREQPQNAPAPPPAQAPPIPPVQLPTRPAPPIAAPAEYPPPQPQVRTPPQPQPGYQQHPTQPQPGGYQQARQPQPGYQQHPPAQPGYGQTQQQPAWQPPPPPRRPPPAPPVAQSSIEALGALAGSPEVHYVEIELSGELSIRGELRSVRVVPRGRGPSQGR